jgi:replication-associated recombination protein RarA
MSFYSKSKTKNGYKLDEISSALQKDVRRGNAERAMFWACELHASGYRNYLWKRLFLFTAEDCAGIITTEVQALHYAWDQYTDKGKKEGGILFAVKAAMLLALSQKSRDVDHLVCIGYLFKDRDEFHAQAKSWLADAEQYDIEDMPDIPDYALCKHTARGRAMGRHSVADFIVDEHEALNPKQAGLFDHLPDEYAKTVSNGNTKRLRRKQAAWDQE